MAIENVLPMEGTNRNPAHTDSRIGALLVENGKLKPSDVDQVIKLHHLSGIRFGEAARRLGLLAEGDLQVALARQHGLPKLFAANEGPSAELVAVHRPYHSLTEELRGLRTQLLLRWLDPAAGRRVLAIVSAGSGEGRSYVAANLAVVFSQLGLKTLLIDADLRNPRQHEIFNISDRIGLASVLGGRADSDAVAMVRGLPRLSLLPAGVLPPNPQELLSRSAFDELLADVTTRFDLVLIDTSAAKVFSDAKSVAFRAKSALLLARKDHTRIDDTNSMIREFSDTGTRIIGTVINAF